MKAGFKKLASYKEYGSMRSESKMNQETEAASLRAAAFALLVPGYHPADEEEDSDFDEEDGESVNNDLGDNDQGVELTDDEENSEDQIKEMSIGDIIGQIGGDFIHDRLLVHLGKGDLDALTCVDGDNVDISGSFTVLDETGDTVQALIFSECKDVSSWEDLADLVDGIVEEIEEQKKVVDEVELFDL